MEIKGTVTTVQGRTFIQEPKTENSKRKIDILPPVRKALKEQFYFKKGAFFFIDSLEKADTTYKKFSQLWHKVLLELGFAKRVLYATRHSFATLMIDKGESILWISKMLGHKNAAITLNFYAKNERTDKEKHAQFLTQREF